MAKLIYSAIASLDGFVNDENGSFDWAAPDDEVHAFVNDLERSAGTYLYGRNGQNNADGSDNNLSWNCGWEGDQDVPPEVMRLRKQQIKNFFTLLMLSNGTPMFCAGDEFMNTQHGNNNPWDQDNETTWLDWSLLEKNKDIFRFFKNMIAFRKAHPSLARSRFWREDVSWYSIDGQVDLGYSSHSLAFCLHGLSQQDHDKRTMAADLHRLLHRHLQIEDRLFWWAMISV
jgi:isoamylase